VRAAWDTTEPYLRDHLSASNFALVRTTLTRHIGIASESSERVLTHGDLWYGNMIISGNDLIGVIDFEALGIGPPLYDFATLKYMGLCFEQRVMGEYRQHATIQGNEVLESYWLFIRELQGLECGSPGESV